MINLFCATREPHRCPDCPPPAAPVPDVHAVVCWPRHFAATSESGLWIIAWSPAKIPARRKMLSSTLTTYVKRRVMWSRNVKTALRSGRRRFSTPHNHGRGQRDCNHSSTELSVRHVVMLDSAVPATGPARSRALRLVSRSTAAYRFVVSTLACPSQWLMVTRSTPHVGGERQRCVDKYADGCAWRRWWVLLSVPARRNAAGDTEHRIWSSVRLGDCEKLGR